MSPTIQFRDVQRVLADADEARATVMASFRSAGGNRDRWGRSDVVAMAAAFTHAEDAIEIGHGDRGRWPAIRASLRDLRRRLEDADDAVDRRRPPLPSTAPELRARGNGVNAGESPL